MPAQPAVVEFLSDDQIPIRVVRSVKRRKTISSQWRDDKLVIQVPASLDARSEAKFVEQMLEKYRAVNSRKQQAHSDEALLKRAEMLDQRYFAGRAQPQSVRWVGNQSKRWGSASLRSGNIRLSAQLKHMPAWVQDYVLVHELVHLVAPQDGHGPKFQALLNRFERREQADLYLSAFNAGYRAASSPPPQVGNVEDQPGGFDFD